MQETQVRSQGQVEKIPWRREWQPTPIFLPGEFHGQRSLAGYSPWGCKESDTTELQTLSFTFRYVDAITLIAESEEELKSLLIKVKKESDKAGLKLNTEKTKIMACGLITSWQIQGGKVEAVTDFIFFGSKITANDDCSHEINRCLLLGRKAMTYLDSILRSRDITLPTKVRTVKAMVFPVVM